MIQLFLFRVVRHVAFALLMAVAIMEGAPCVVAAPADIQESTQQSERIQREQLRRQQEDIERTIESRRPPTHIEVPGQPGQAGQGQGCRRIDHIELQDAVHMFKAEEEALIQPYLGKCLGVDEIQKLLSDITTFYVNKGYVTTRVYLPAQDLSTGTLIVKIVPGKVSRLENDKEATQLSHLGNVFPGVVGKDLNLRDFEQGIDQLNRLLSNNAAIDIRPGEQVGASDIIVKNQPGRPWHLNFSADNYGAGNTGRSQLGATASLDNLTGFNDFLSVTQRNTVPFGDDQKQSSATSGLFIVPYGYATVTVGITGSNYDSTLYTAGGHDLHLNGDNLLVFATLDRVVYRDQQGKASVYATLTSETTNSYIEGQKLTVSSRKLSYLQLGANYNTGAIGGAVNLGVAYTRGLTMFGAVEDPNGISDAVPHAQFDKYTLSAGYSRSFALASNQFTFSTQFSGQHAPEALYGSQQFSVGGMYTVRGFLSEQLANDNGYFLRNDLTLVKSLDLVGRKVGFRPFVALDVGSVDSNHEDTPTGALCGAAVGFDLVRGPVDFNIFTGYPLSYPQGVSNEGFTLLSRLSFMF